MRKSDVRGPDGSARLRELAVDEVKEVLPGNGASLSIVGAIADDAGVDTVVEVGLVGLVEGVGLVTDSEVRDDGGLQMQMKVSICAEDGCTIITYTHRDGSGHTCPARPDVLRVDRTNTGAEL